MINLGNRLLTSSTPHLGHVRRWYQQGPPTPATPMSYRVPLTIKIATPVTRPSNGRQTDADRERLMKHVTL